MTPTTPSAVVTNTFFYKTHNNEEEKESSDVFGTHGSALYISAFSGCNSYTVTDTLDHFSTLSLENARSHFTLPGTILFSQ